MGDMSDLPNFKRSWWRRIGKVRLVFTVLIVLAVAITWSFSEQPVGSNLEITLLPSELPPLVGTEYRVRGRLKNNGDKTVAAEVQLAFVALKDEDACAKEGQNLTFSLPQRIKIAPNEILDQDFPIDVNVKCETKVGTKIFINGVIDNTQRFSIQKDGNLTLNIL